MNEWSLDELSSFFTNQNSGLIYFYTPLCGTCQVAARMLQVIEHLVDVTIGKINVNYSSAIAKELAIESVPCLLLIKDGKVMETIYAFHSVPYLLDKINETIT